MKTLMIEKTINELSEETQKIFRESVKREIKTTFTRENEGWTIHCEFLGEPIQHKSVYDSELDENEIIEQFYTKYVEPELIDLVLSGQHTLPINVVIRIQPVTSDDS